MDRRTFVLLTGATSGALIRPPVRLSHSPTGADRRSGGPAGGGGRVARGEDHRWALWGLCGGPPRPLFPGGRNVAGGGGPARPPPEPGKRNVGKPRPPGAA